VKPRSATFWSPNQFLRQRYPGENILPAARPYAQARRGVSERRARCDRVASPRRCKFRDGRRVQVLLFQCIQASVTIKTARRWAADGWPSAQAPAMTFQSGSVAVFRCQRCAPPSSTNSNAMLNSRTGRHRISLPLQPPLSSSFRSRESARGKTTAVLAVGGRGPLISARLGDRRGFGETRFVRSAPRRPSAVFRGVCGRV